MCRGPRGVLSEGCSHIGADLVYNGSGVFHLRHLDSSSLRKTARLRRGLATWAAADAGVRRDTLMLEQTLEQW